MGVRKAHFGLDYCLDAFRGLVDSLSRLLKIYEPLLSL